MWRIEALDWLLLTGLSWPASSQLLLPEHSSLNEALWLQSEE